MRLSQYAISTIAAILVVSCAVQQPAPPEQILETSMPSTQLEEQFVSASGPPGEVDDAWLANFIDPQLNALVDEVLQNNLNLQAAAAKVDMAAGLAIQAGAALKPAVGLAAGSSTVDASGLQTELQSSNAFLNASWELDIWGRVRAQAAAGEAGFEATQADFEFARQSLVAQTCKAWFLATQVKQQLELANEAVAIYERLLELVTARTKSGRAQPQDLPLAKANLAGARNNQRLITGSYHDILRSIEVLLGRYPSADLRASNEFVAQLPDVPVGLPSQILERRPDLIAAERRVAAAFFGEQQAEAARMPRISLTATAGAIDSGLADMLGVGDPVAALGADIFAPLYAGGALQAGVEIAEAQKRASMAVYAQKVLLALRDVESALANEKLYAERADLIQEIVDKSTEAFRITQVQYEVGRLDFLTVLQAQASLLGARSQQIAMRNEQLAQRVDLHLALGGSFE